MLFVYEDAEKRRQFKNKYCDYKFVGPTWMNLCNGSQIFLKK